MFNITNGNIKAGVLYLVYGTQSVIYNGTTYSTGNKFRGLMSVTSYIFSGSGTQFVYELLEVDGAGILFRENAIISDNTKLNGFTIEYLQSAGDIVSNAVTMLNGFAIELMDYPFYSFSIVEM